MPPPRLRTTAVITVVGSVLLAAFLAVPAIGGPSLETVYKIAKKALGTSDSANRKAKRAQSIADRALRRAGQLPSRGVTANDLRTVPGPTNAIPPLDAGRSIAFCPAGSKVISGGGFAVTPGADGMTASLASDDRSAWVVIGGNTTLRDGSVQAIAYCAAAGQAGSARTDRRAVIRRAARLEERARAALRPPRPRSSAAE